VTYWVRFRHTTQPALERFRIQISVHDGEMFGESWDNGGRVALSDVELMRRASHPRSSPVDNFHALAAKLNVREPDEPLYLLKAPTTAAPPNAPSNARRPMTARSSTKANRHRHWAPVQRRLGRSGRRLYHGYTCVNDITAPTSSAGMPRSRNGHAQGFDDFARSGLSSRRDRPRQTRCPDHTEWRRAPIVSDIGHDLSAQQLVSKISHDMTLLPAT